MPRQPQRGHEDAEEGERRDQHGQAREPRARSSSRNASVADPGHERDRARRGSVSGGGGSRRVAGTKDDAVQQRAGASSEHARARAARARSARPEPAARPRPGRARRPAGSDATSSAGRAPRPARAGRGAEARARLTRALPRSAQALHLLAHLARRPAPSRRRGSSARRRARSGSPRGWLRPAQVRARLLEQDLGAALHREARRPRRRSRAPRACGSRARRRARKLRARASRTLASSARRPGAWRPHGSRGAPAADPRR